MRVLHVHSGNLYGGVETTLLAQARHRDSCPEMELSFALCFGGRFSEELRAADAPVHWLGEARVRRPLSIRRVRRRLAELLQRHSFDVVVTHSAWSQAIFGSVVRSAQLPLIFWLHGAAQGRHWLERWARHTFPDLVLCNSQFTATTIHNLYPHTPAEVVYYPKELSEIPAPGLEREAVRAELETPEDAVVIIQVSRMEALKGQAVHIRALSLLKDIPDWVCWLVGGAQRQQEIRYFQELKELTNELGIAGRVRFPGQRSDVSRLLKAADIYCQPNTDPEGFGLTFIEALFECLPVVTTAIGGAKEIVDETCGVLVPPDDVQVLAATLRRLIQDRTLRRRLGAVGPARALTLCDAPNQLRQIHKCISSLSRNN